MEAILKKNRIILFFPYNYVLLNKVKKITGRKWHTLERYWTVPLTAIGDIENLGFNTEQIKADLKEKTDYKTTIFPEVDGIVKLNYPFLRDYQHECVVKGVIEERLLITDKMGLGKTIEGLAIADYYKHADKIKRIIILCPETIKKQWQKEALKWFGLHLTVIKGTKSQRVELYKHSVDGIILNYELLVQDFPQVYRQSAGEVVIFDEASYLKNEKAKRTIVSNKLKAKYTYALTGTPIETKIRDGFNIGNLVEPGWMSKQEFFDNYCIIKPVRKTIDEETGEPIIHKAVVGYKNEASFLWELGKISIGRSKKDIKGFPMKIVHKRIVPLSPQQIVIEEFIKRHMKTEQDITKFIIFQMLENGVELLAESNSRLARIVKQNFKLKPDSNKLRELVHVVDEMDDKKIVIFTKFRKMQPFIVDTLGKDNCHVGNASTKDKMKLKNNFETSDKRFLIVTNAFSYGVDVPFASGLINFDIPWNHAKLEQQEDRIDRGQQQANIVNFVSEGFENDIVYEKMILGKNMDNNFFEILKNYVRLK